MQVFFRLLVLIGLVSAAVTAHADYRLHYKVQGEVRELLNITPHIQSESVGEKKLLRKIPYYIHNTDPKVQNIWYEEYAVSKNEVSASMLAKFQSLTADVEFQSTEVRVLVAQGPKENRINLTILGDGYTLAEKERFFADSERTVRGLFDGQTFQSYLPLFNIYAVFVASAESGIGDGRSKNTAFRLYRTPAGSKRAIMPGDQRALEAALRLAPATDYPIVIANDDYYGGLGGRYAISTRSEKTGLIVLRHELGHNFGEVGEEYDNGQVYMGANASSSSRVPWGHWVQGQTPVHEAKLMSGDYVWKNLGQGAYRANFTIPALIEKMLFILSSVGWETANDVEVKLNDQKLNYEGVFHDDRSFFNVEPQAVVPGQRYQLSIEEKVADGNNVLGFALAYGLPATYDMTPNVVGAFASYDTNGRKSYRPTHGSCLMRNMEVDNFCVVDQENMWVKFLNRVRLIDTVKKTINPTNNLPEVVLQTQNLPGLSVRWFAVNGSQENEIISARDQHRLAPVQGVQKVRVRVEYRTPEVRKYNSRFDDSAEIAL